MSATFTRSRISAHIGERKRAEPQRVGRFGVDVDIEWIVRMAP